MEDSSWHCRRYLMLQMSSWMCTSKQSQGQHCKPLCTFSMNFKHTASITTTKDTSTLQVFCESGVRIWTCIQYVMDLWACAMYILSCISKGERQLGLLLWIASREAGDNDDIQKQVRWLGNMFLTHCEVSAQEAAYRVLSFPLQKHLWQVVFVNTSMSADQVRILKPKGKATSAGQVINKFLRLIW